VDVGIRCEDSSTKVKGEFSPLLQVSVGLQNSKLMKFFREVLLGKGKRKGAGILPGSPEIDELL